MTASVDRLRRLITGFTGKTIVVVGDVIIDEYLFGKPARISREAPVVILRFAEREVRLGGAANAAHNVRALGARVQPIGVVGRDAAGDELLGLFHGVGMPTDGLAVETGRAVDATSGAILILSVLLASAAAGAFNQYVERGLDVKMARTRGRPFAGPMPNTAK